MVPEHDIHSSILFHKVYTKISADSTKLNTHRGVKVQDCKRTPEEIEPPTARGLEQATLLVWLLILSHPR